MKTGLLTALMAVSIFSLSAAFMSWNAEQTVEISNYKIENVELSPLSGSSSLSCRSNIQLSLGYEGYGVLEPEMLLADRFSDYSRFEVVIVDPPVNTDTADCSMVGDHIMVEVRDTVNNMMCWSSVLVEDKLPPQVSCDTVDASCNLDPYANNYNIYLPDLDDNCTDTSDLSITYTQSQISQGCQSDYVLIINRTWFITDEYGNTTTCDQIIRLERPDIDSVEFPENDTLYCPNTDTDPTITGMPTLNGEEVSMQCGLMVWNEDNVIDECGGTFKVLRTWYVMDWCQNEQRSNLQMIFIRDTTAPVITCPADETITNAPGECYAFYDIPEIDVTDDCADSSDLNFDFYVNGVYSNQTENIQLPVGDNSIRVVVEDGCFNYSECTYKVTVIDSETPTVVCFDDYFALPSSGAATVGPEAFTAIDYMDNCGVVDTVIRRMNTHCGNSDDLNFGDEITFCCEDVGDTIMVEVKAFDAAGNMNSCMFEVIVQDNIPPMVMCPADTTVNCDQLTGDLSIFGSPVITDNCAFTVDSSESVNLDACKEGIITRTWIATDEFGNMSSCTQTITVVNPYEFDSTSIRWPADTVLSACNMGGTHPDSIGSVPQFDQTPCETVGVTFTDMTMDPDSACLDLMRTWTIYDSCEDRAFTHVQMVQIINNAPPVLIVPSDTLLYANGNCHGIAALDSAFTNDCSSGVTFENSYTEGGALVDTLFPLGSTVIIFTATDECNNVSTDTTIVTVQDTTPPEIICIPDTVISTDPLVCEGTVDLPGPFTSDNCSVDSVVNDYNFTADASDTYPIGTTTVTYTVYDGSGNSSTCSFTVTVEDDEPPVLSCPTDTILLYLDESCEVDIPDFTDSISVSDNCSPVDSIQFVQTPMTGTTLMMVQDTFVQIIATDTSGNSDTCQIAISLVDTLPPSIICPDDDTLYADINCEGIIGNYRDQAMVMSNCTQMMDIEINQTPDSGTVISGAGTIVVVTMTAEDASGNMMSCTFEITLLDTTPPTITCPADVTVSTDLGVCEADLSINIPGNSDNCIVDSVYNDFNGTIDASDTYPLGETIVTYTVVDNSGNSATCSFTVTVEDDEPPVVICPADQTINLDSMCEAVIPDFQDSISVSDNCTSVNDITVNQMPAPGTVYSGTGDTTVVIIVFDEAGNSDTCDFVITFEDTIPPTITCPSAQTLYVDSTCSVILPDYTGVVVTDNCANSGEITVTQSPSAGDTLIAPDTVTVTLTATDNSGNTAQCSFEVYVLDTINPMITCPADVTVSTDLGVCEANVSISIPMYSDNCIVDTVFNDKNGTIDASGIYPLGVTVVTYTVVDNSGNSTTCSFTVTVEDDEPPVVNCPPDLTIQLNPSCEAVIPYFQDSIIVSDNCTPTVDIGYTQTPDSGTVVSGEGDTLVQIIVTDDAGNSDTCSFTIFFVDTVPPSITCPPTDTLYVDTLCSAVIGDYRPDAIISDNCTDTSLITIDQVPDSGTIVSGSDTIIVVSLIATDLSGNSDTCTFNIELLDTIQPSIACPDDVTLFADAECKAIIPDLTDSVVIADNCDPDMTIMATQSPSPGDTLMGEQTITITFTATDMNGQTQTCEISLTVVDTIPPTVICPPDSQLIADSLCQVTIPDVVNETFISDNCTDSIDLIVTQTPSADSIVDAQPGDTVCVVVTVQDSSGNIDSCEVKFEVIDTTAPTLICTGDTTTIALDNNCAGAIPDLDGEITTLEDNCTGVNNITITQIPSPGTVFILSAPLDTTVVITVTDSFGNSSSCSLVVSFVDTTPPVITCPPDTLVACGFTFNSLDTFGSAIAIDNCSPVTVSTNSLIHLNDCELIDSITRVFTATDENGNSSTCTQIIRYDGTIARLDVDDFTYPDTVLVADCNFLEPSDIPGSIPEIDTSLMLCNVIGYEYADSIIDNPSLGCIEILRTFTMTDSCYFDTDSTNAQFELEQYIIVQDTSSPSFTVPVLDTMVYMDSCGTVDVILDSVTASDCAGIDTIYNNSAYAFSNSGGDISGAYEFGIHNVNVFAIDSCGNIDSVNIQITVTDSFPDTLICNFKIINDLDSNTLTSIFISHEFLGGYTDSCGNPPLGEITTSFDPMDLSDTIQIITCDSIDTVGGNYIQEGLIYVFLDSMLIDSCVIEMGIENPEICDTMMNIVAGQIVTPRAEMFNNAHVSVSNEATSKSSTTNEQGLYTVERLMPDRMYFVDPDYGGDPRAGVSTFDILLVMRHILGIEEIENPYFNIAGDVDKSQTISAADIIHMRKLLLRVEDEMPVDNWRFVAEDYDFLNTTTAYSENYTEKILVDLSSDVSDVDFVGLKVGDVDGSVDMQVKGRSAPTILEIRKGDHNTVDLISTKTEMIYGFQMAIAPDEMGSLQLIDGMVEFNYENYRILENGNILISWIAPYGLPVEKGETLFSISGVRTDKIHKSISMNPETMSPEAYWRDENGPSAIELRYTESYEEFALYQNIPNPWIDRTLISYTLQKAENVKINVIDATGKQVFESKLEGKAGYNELILRSTDLDGPGIYYYQLKGESFNASKKMILLQ